MWIDPEEWRKVPSDPRYSVSRDGRVRNDVKRQGTYPGKILRPYWCGDYLGVSLWGDGKSVKRTVHSLVAEAFIGPRPDGLIVNHKDFDKRNNAVSNLEYVTYSENTKHAFAALKLDFKGENNGRALLSRMQVRRIRRLYSEGVSQRKLAERFSMSRSAIVAIVRGRNWAHTGAPVRKRKRVSRYAPDSVKIEAAIG